MIRTSLFALSFSLLTACVSVETHHSHDTDETRPPPGSNLMLRAPITISDDLEVIISDVVIPPGATVPAHYHPGEEFLYVIEGSAVHVEAGKPDQILSAGDAYVIPPEAEHAPRGAEAKPGVGASGRLLGCEPLVGCDRGAKAVARLGEIEVIARCDVTAGQRREE